MAVSLWYRLVGSGIWGFGLPHQQQYTSANIYVVVFFDLEILSVECV